MITPPGTFPSPSLGTYSPLPPTQNPDQNVLLLPSSCPLMQVPRMGVGAVSSMDPSGTQAWSLALNGWLRQKSPCRRQYPSLPGSSQEGGSLTPEGGGRREPPARCQHSRGSSLPARPAQNNTMGVAHGSQHGCPTGPAWLLEWPSLCPRVLWAPDPPGLGGLSEMESLGLGHRWAQVWRTAPAI